MELKSDTAVLELQPGQIITLDDAEGTSIRARCGTVWITEEGEQDDFVLNAGDNRIVAKSGRTLIQAIHTSWISIWGPREIASLRRAA